MTCGPNPTHRRLVWFVWVWCAFQVPSASVLAESPPLLSVAPALTTRELVPAFAALGSRVPGYPGSTSARQYVLGAFRSLGLPHVGTQPFLLPMPVEREASLELLPSGERVPLHALWPNTVVSSQLPKEGLAGPLLSAGRGRLADFDGRRVAGAVVLLDFDCGMDWLNAPMLGARAVVFLAPEDTTQAEATRKYLQTPCRIPRFWIDRASGLRLRDAPPTRVRLTCAMPWENVRAENVYAFLPGTDAARRPETVVVTAYYDSTSAVPALAPGAEQAGGIAALLQLAARCAQHPPTRSVLFVALDAHFQALAGPRELVWVLQRGRKTLEADANALGVEADKREQRVTAFGTPSANAIEAVRADEALTKRVVGVMSYQTLLARDAILRLTLSKVPDAETRIAKHRQTTAELDLLSNLFSRYLRKVRFADLSGEQRTLLQRQFALARAELLREARDLRTRQTLVRGSLPLARLTEKHKPVFYLGIDLSGGTQQVGLFYKGHFFDQNETFERTYADLAETIQKLARETKPPGSSVQYLDTMRVLAGKPWQSFLPTPMAFDGEVAQVVGLPALTAATLYDARVHWDTPFDTPNEQSLERLDAQAQFVAGLFRRLIDAPELSHDFGLAKLATVKTCLLTGEAKTLGGQISAFPDRPVPDSLLVARHGKSFTGVRGAMVARADGTGYFRFPCVPYLRWYRFEAYHLGDDGGIDFANDNGRLEKRFPLSLQMTREDVSRLIALFPCETKDLYDLMDQRSLNYPAELRLFDARTDSAPQRFGVSYASGWGEGCAAVFVSPLSRFKLLLSQGLTGLRGALLRASKLQPRGEGIQVEQIAEGVPTAYQLARDLYALNHYRMEAFIKHNVRNGRLEKLHATSKAYLQEAAKALAERRYTKCVNDSRFASALESRAYPDVLGTANDAIKGVVFYLLMLVPFSYCLERLLLRSVRLERQLLGFFGVFVLSFLVLRMVHPAFALTNAPFMVLLAFVILALAMLVIWLLYSKFNDQMREMQQSGEYIPGADVNRAGLALVSVNLGLSNLRQRPIRTVLTAVTIVVTTFTMLSFTGVGQYLRDRRLDLKRQPPYQGLLLNSRGWAPLPVRAREVIAETFGEHYPVAARSWLTATQAAAAEGHLTYEVYSETAGARRAHQLEALVGLTPEERQFLAQPKLLTAGEWFAPGERLVCLLPESVAKALGIRPEQLLSTPDAPTVTLFGIQFRVKGILRDAALKDTLDLNGEALTPVDFAKQQLMQSQKADTAKAQALDEVAASGDESTSYLHFLPNEVIALPFETVRDLGGDLRSLAVRPAKGGFAEDDVARLSRRLEMNVFWGTGSKSYFVSTAPTTGVTGLQNLIVPLLIACLILLNTMLGAVYERRRDIGIYSSLGLSPQHTSTLFFIESGVVATLGAVFGYLFGQVFAKLASTLNLQTGMTFNYSSTSVVMVAMLAIAMVLTSTAYPAGQASKMAMAGIGRHWQVPRPSGDELFIRTPFTFSGDQVPAMMAYMHQWFTQHGETSIGLFFAEEIATGVTQASAPPNARTRSGATQRSLQQVGASGSVGGGDCTEDALYLTAMVSLTPYDMGVRQRLGLYAFRDPEQEDEVSSLDLYCIRTGGHPDAWERTNRQFLDALRKQVLIWRIVGPVQRAQFAEQAERLFGQDGQD